jgi:hypothetical protein
MLRVPVQSKSGNVLVGILGVIYAVSSLVVLVLFVRDAWGSAGLTDRALQVWLLVSAISGVWFIVCAMENLGLTRRDLPHLFRRISSHH